MRLLKVLCFVLFFAGSLFAEPTPTELYELKFRIEREYSKRASDILEKIAGKGNYAVSVIVDLGITKKNPAQISRMSLIVVIDQKITSRTVDIIRSSLTKGLKLDMRRDDELFIEKAPFKKENIFTRVREKAHLILSGIIVIFFGLALEWLLFYKKSKPAEKENGESKPGFSRYRRILFLAIIVFGILFFLGCHFGKCGKSGSDFPGRGKNEDKGFFLPGIPIKEGALNKNSEFFLPGIPLKAPAVLPRTKDEASNVVETVPEGMTSVEKKLYDCLEYFYQGKYDKIVSGCREILKLEPDNITALMRLGSAYFAMGNKKEAVKTWQGVIERDPTNEEMKKLIRSL